MSHKLTQNYSSIVLNQNQVYDSSVDAALYAATFKQEFHLPANYRRGTASGELRYPDLSGFQLLVDITEDCAPYAAFDYEVEYQVVGIGWITVASGTAIGAPNDGIAWMTATFEDPLEIDETLAAARWRLVFTADERPFDNSGAKDVVVPYANGEANVFGTIVEASLIKGEPYHFVYDGLGSFLFMDIDDQVYFSVEQGLATFQVTSPNPLAVPHLDQAYDFTDLVLAGLNGPTAAFNFRILALTAEEGVDFLGNEYRSVVVRNKADVISTALGADPDAYWLSKPNPSKFAVESLYFDMRVSDEAAVIDRVLIDPITPGAYFAVYYTEEGEPGTNEDQWDDKLWNRIPQTYRMERKETHVFPEPVRAKYLKIEFSHLQARHYAPGNFQQTIRYKKHPKWVLDYFLARMQTDAAFLAQRVTVVYDALDLAYNYYIDDLGQEPEVAVNVDDSELRKVTGFLSDRGDASDRIDTTTLNRINLVLDPYRKHPALRGYASTLLGDYARQTVSVNEDYPVEGARPLTPTTPDVSSLNRERVVLEQDYPVMSFFLTCRHKYREIEATFTHDRAYFVGVRQIAFLRDNYMTAFDTGTYIEPAADTLNVERNEFV